ncbi:hypothetical protein GIB67_034375 [Kingdonia uniflora]|uniref:Uncharacterized protein n=1 Tax=Kingdonia uniflora TaxID=39325 RepID=A0A7J7NSB2_9MAGN|nr:hypothetical protein GIB67_034375 [Kingdonia uniflora]
MRRQGQYSDSGAHSYAAQMQQISAQRMQHGSGTNHFSGRPDALPSDEDRPYGSSKVEGQWQWELDGPKGLKPMSPHIFNEGKIAAQVYSSSGNFCFMV